MIFCTSFRLFQTPQSSVPPLDYPRLHNSPCFSPYLELRHLPRIMFLTVYLNFYLCTFYLFYGHTLFPDFLPESVWRRPLLVLSQLCLHPHSSFQIRQTQKQSAPLMTHRLGLALTPAVLYPSSTTQTHSFPPRLTHFLTLLFCPSQTLPDSSSH